MKRTSPILVIGLPLIVVILVYMYVFEPLRSNLASMRDALSTQEMKIEMTQNRIKRLKRLLKEKRQVKKEVQELRKSLVPGKSLQEVATSLQNDFLEKAKKNKVEVLVYRPAQKRKWKDFQVAAVVFNLKTHLEPFVELLEDLQREKRIQRTNNISLSTIRGMKDLRINLEVEALFWPNEEAH